MKARLGVNKMEPLLLLANTNKKLFFVTQTQIQMHMIVSADPVCRDCYEVVLVCAHMIQFSMFIC